MASQDIVVPEELQSAEASPSTVSCLYPKLDYAKQNWIGVNLDISRHIFAKPHKFVNINDFSFCEVACFQLLDIGAVIAITGV